MNLSLDSFNISGGRWWVIGLCVVSSLGCVQQQKYQTALTAAKRYEELYNSLHAYQGELESRNRDLETQLAKAHVEGAEGLAVYQDATQLKHEYDRRMRALEASFQGTEGWKEGDVEIFRTADGNEVFRIKDAVLFDSGSSSIKSAGKKLIQEIASQIPDQKRIRVEGHTDSDPVVRSIDKFPYGNLQLSSARAMEVAHLLIQDGKISAERVSIAGYGENRPVVPNDSTTNKRKNRRVEIVVLNGESPAKK